MTERKPQRVTTDKHPPYRRAIRWILGRKVVHRTNPYLNNLTEQDHRAVKQRYYPDARFRELRLSGTLLLGVSGAPPVLARSRSPQRGRPPGPSSDDASSGAGMH